MRIKFVGITRDIPNQLYTSYHTRCDNSHKQNKCTYGSCYWEWL